LGHFGGDLNFGPDDYLYFGMGDGSVGLEAGRRSQNQQCLFGKMIRIDVNTAVYSIPPSNPFVNNPDILGEIWATGLRNPWRFSFDRLTGDMWIGDDGENSWEEVDFQPASSKGGENYGWQCYEGNHPFDTSGCSGNFVFPVYEYPNPNRCAAIIGGYVYRGSLYPKLYGHYIFVDYCSGVFKTIYNHNGKWLTTNQGQHLMNAYSSFGEDNNGELYVAAMYEGEIFHITEASPAHVSAMAQVDGFFRKLMKSF
jgi:glucose/arabinose dehydrogenase